MNILQIVTIFYPPFTSGPAFSTRQISEELARRGHNVYVYTTNAYDRRRTFEVLNEHFIFKKSTLTIYYFRNNLYIPSKHLFFSLPFIRKLRKNIKMMNIVHLNEYRNYLTPIIFYIISKFNKPYIIQARGQIPYNIGNKKGKILFDNLIGKHILKCASRIIALNNFEANQYKAIGVPDDKISIIPNGINIKKYTLFDFKNTLRKRLHLEDETKIVLFLGRINYIKGIDILIKATYYLIKKIRYNKFIVIIAGPDDGFLISSKKMVLQMDLNKNIIFLGPLRGVNKIEVLMDADCLVLPSRYEIFGNVILEAYACGKPVIASNVGGLKELVEHGKTGFLFDNEDYKKLAWLMYFLLTADKLRFSMGINAKNKVKSFSIEKIVDKLEKIYRDCLND